jgi:predicted transcriptional regulator
MEFTQSDSQGVPTWRDATREQGRTLRWLARMTGIAQRTVYAYSQGQLVPSDDWLARVGELLGVAVTHVPCACAACRLRRGA